VTHVSFVVGVVPFLEYCGTACKLFDGDAFQGCSNAVVYSKVFNDQAAINLVSQTNFNVTTVTLNDYYTAFNTNPTNDITFNLTGAIACIRMVVTNDDLVNSATFTMGGNSYTVLAGETISHTGTFGVGTTFTATGPGIIATNLKVDIFKSEDCKNEFPPYAFVMGRNSSNCGTNLTSYCLCDEIILTSTSPVEGETINNEWQGPNKNDFVQVFGYGTGMSGQTVGAVQQFQIGVAQGEYLVMANVNQGPLQFGTYNVANNTWIWGAVQKTANGNPTIYFVDRPDRYYFIYSFRFPNQDILPSCTGSTTTTYEPIPTTTTAYPFPTTTTSTSTTCL
jgi:hypothetical protein